MREARGHPRGRPAPELDTLIRSLKSYVTGRAKVGKRSLVQRVWVEYAPATVLASVRFRNVKGLSKDLIRFGVLALYPDAAFNDLEQDVLDAIAVGHCHLSKTREASILGQASPVLVNLLQIKGRHGPAVLGACSEGA